MEDGRHRQGNTLEQEAQETIKKCSREANQKKSKVYRLLTRNENKNGKTQGLFEW